MTRKRKDGGGEEKLGAAEDALGDSHLGFCEAYERARVIRRLADVGYHDDADPESLSARDLFLAIGCIARVLDQEAEAAADRTDEAGIRARGLVPESDRGEEAA